MKKHHLLLTVLSIAMLLLLSGCGPKGESVESAVVEVAPASPAGSFLLADIPPDAKDLLEGLASAAPEEPILVKGRVGGTLEPLSSEFAGFVLSDEVIVFCDEMGKDGHCPTPWDACCEDPEKISASRAFVQFVNTEGFPLQVNLKEAIGLQENDAVIVKGYLSPDSTPDNRIIIAQGIAIGS
ncbi:MAG: hypothetical protein AB3N33_06980 [Puniceicoccaceae bacterium]